MQRSRVIEAMAQTTSSYRLASTQRPAALRSTRQRRASACAALNKVNIKVEGMVCDKCTERVESVLKVRLDSRQAHNEAAAGVDSAQVL